MIQQYDVFITSTRLGLILLVTIFESRKHVLIAVVGPCDVGVVFVFLLQQSRCDGVIGQAVTLKSKIQYNTDVMDVIPEKIRNEEMGA